MTRWPYLRFHLYLHLIIGIRIPGYVHYIQSVPSSRIRHDFCNLKTGIRLWIPLIDISLLCFCLLYILRKLYIVSNIEFPFSTKLRNCKTKIKKTVFLRRTVLHPISYRTENVFFYIPRKDISWGGFQYSINKCLRLT